MEKASYWKNFRLGEELHIAGSFIYNGMRQFHELVKLDMPDELFEFLYDLSVGLERLLKIAVVLYEHVDGGDQEALEKSLITHSHQELVARIRVHVDLKLAATHNDLLSMLGTFYKTLRYDRFSLTSVYLSEKEAKALKELLAKHLSIEFPAERSIFGTDNEDRYRKFIQRTVLKISQSVFDAIDARARTLNLYTYELRHGSKAQSVFLRQVKIGDEDVLWKELLIFFMNVEPTTGYLKLLKSVPPLDFDPADVPDYLACFKSDAAKAGVMDHLEYHYEEMGKEERNKRLELISLVGERHLSFPEDEGDESFEAYDSVEPDEPDDLAS